MPFVSQTVMLDGNPYLDGGIADAIPIDYSLELGAEKHIVLLTQDRDYAKEPSHSPDYARLLYRQYPEFISKMEERPGIYNASREKVFEMHDAGEAFAIWPERRPEVAHMETDRAKLFDLYMEGWLRAARAWPALRAYLES